MAKVTDEELQSQFSEFGLDVAATDLLDKLRELCLVHRFDAERMAGEWMAYKLTKKTTTLLTVENLDNMEREKLSKTNSKSNKGSKNAKVYNVSSIETLEDDATDELLGAYGTPNSKVKKRQHTPDMPQNKRVMGLGRSPVVPFSPSSFSPASSTPSEKYSGRKNKGEVVCSFGAADKVSWKSVRDAPCKVNQYAPNDSLTQRFKYMFQKMADKAHVLNDMIQDMGEVLKSHHNIGEFTHMSLPAQEPVTVCGRVCCDSNGKINAQSVVLEGSRDTSAGKQIPVDLSGVQQYSLFPGQIVAMEGINLTGNKFVAKKIFDNVPLPMASTDNVLSNGALSVVVATGPFTTSDNTQYEPLNDLIHHLNTNPPDLCILLGPFIDSKNPELEKLYAARTFEEHYRAILDELVKNTSRTNIKFLIVPSQRDAHCDFVYPQPPFKVKIDKKENHPRVQFLSDPCTLTIDGVVLGISSTDILFHLGAEEMSCNPQGASDRLARLTKHIITQHSYYPLYPPPEEVNIDYDQFEEYARLSVTPHVLIVPSELRYFIKDISGCCCINPGRLAKGQIGGTFARFRVAPTGNTADKTLTNNITAQVLRI